MPTEGDREHISLARAFFRYANRKIKSTVCNIQKWSKNNSAVPPAPAAPLFGCGSCVLPGFRVLLALCLKATESTPAPTPPAPAAALASTSMADLYGGFEVKGTHQPI
jgi:hypothetical protein